MAPANVHSSRGRTAPFYSVPDRQIVSVEHPCVINSVDKAIQSLDGRETISKMLGASKRDSSISLFLRPEDAMSRPVDSICTTTNNVLLKVTVPKRTGRKRKRGSSEPYADDPEEADRSLDARTFRRILQDNASRYDVEAVGRVERAHVFRGMPDFAFSTTTSPFMTKFREKVLPFQYDKLKEFDLDMSKGATTNVDIVPPPSLSRGNIPFSYFYRQNPSVRHAVSKSGQVTTVNTQAPNKIHTHLVPYDIPEVPSAPRDSCPPISTLDEIVQKTIVAVENLFKERPAWTRRGLRNSLASQDQKNALKLAIPYVAYIFRSGPWIDAIVRFNYDPRTTPEARMYQTFMFHIVSASTEADESTTTTAVSGRRRTAMKSSRASAVTNAPPDSHIFNNVAPLSRDGKMWMLCDIKDPLLTRILTMLSPRPTCDIYFSGWFPNVRLATAKAIMRLKIQSLITQNESVTLSEDELQLLLQFPEHIETKEELEKLLIEGARDPGMTKCVSIASHIRSFLRGAPGIKKMPQIRQRNDDGRGRKRVRWGDEEAGEVEEGEEGEEGEDSGEEQEEEQEEEEEEEEEEDIMMKEEDGNDEGNGEEPDESGGE